MHFKLLQVIVPIHVIGRRCLVQVPRPVVIVILLEAALTCVPFALPRNQEKEWRYFRVVGVNRVQPYFWHVPKPSFSPFIEEFDGNKLWHGPICQNLQDVLLFDTTLNFAESRFTDNQGILVQLQTAQIYLDPETVDEKEEYADCE